MNRRPTTADITAEANGDPDFPFGANAPADRPAPAGHPPPPPDAPDPMDPSSLRLPDDLPVGLGVKKAVLSVPIRKPDRSWFVRVHPDPSYRLQTAVIELKEDRELFLVRRELWQGLAAESTFTPRVLFTAVNRQGVLFLW